MAIRRAHSPEDYAAFGELVAEYSDWLSARHAEDSWFIEAVLRHQSLDKELQEIEAVYGPPGGEAWLAEIDGVVAGGVALRALSAGTCEMKRMFVRDGFRGHGLGGELCETIIAAGRAKGYRLMQLDTSRRLNEAISLYRGMGFVECPPYREYPRVLGPRLLFLELRLDQPRAASRPSS